MFYRCINIFNYIDTINEGCPSFAEPDACCSGLYCNKGACDPCSAPGANCNGAYPGECGGGKFLCDGDVLYDMYYQIRYMLNLTLTINFLTNCNSALFSEFMP